MTNHYHIVVETPDGNLSRGMRQLNGVYTQNYNRHHGLVGHLWQGRFQAILVERDSYLLELSRYVVLNPVRAGMVSAVADWPWSSFRAMVGLEERPPWLEINWMLGQFGNDRQQAQQQYSAFVYAGVGQTSVWESLRHQIFLGSATFAEHMMGIKRQPETLQEIPRAQRRPSAKPLAHFAEAFADRREGMARAFQTGVYTMKEVADYFGVHYSTVSRAVRWFEQVCVDKPQ
jgi:hypothetical protein